MCKPSVRLPLVEAREETKKKVSEVKVARSTLMKQKLSPGHKIICLNRKASFNYFFLEMFEGISLKGSEVKSLRDGKEV